MSTTEKGPFLLTTLDNPYSPFSSYVQWYMEDQRLGHDTCGLLARLTNSSNLYDDGAEEQAMRDIVTYNVSGKHIMVVPTDYDPFLVVENFV